MSAPDVTPGRPRRNDALCTVREQAILSAAIRLFGRKGFTATRAEDIAAAAGLAKGTVYLYFKNKESIYVAAVGQALRDLHVELARRTVEGGDLAQRLHTEIRVRLEFWPAHEGIYRLLLTIGRETRLRRQTNEVLRRAHASFLAIFERAVFEGEIPAMDFHPVAWAVLDMVRGCTERRMDKLSGSTPLEDADLIARFVLSQVMPLPEALRRRA